MKSLRISRNLALPLEAVTQTFAILAKRGVGKTYLALVMTEELLKAGLQVVVVDPVGVCWGLRSSADGKRPGLPIIVLGGDHGDVPLEASAGETIANFIIEEHQSAVLDLSLFRKNEQVRFMTDFAERLYLKNRSALHLVLDEADAFAPQRPMPGQQRMLGTMQDLVRRGRARGIGVTLVTQRAAVLSKDVLTQVEVLVALRTISPQDRKAVEAWIAAHDVEDKRDAFMESLPSLPIGTAWFWSPGWLDIFKKVSVRKRETFDSSATPKAGSRAAQPRKLAPVDLDALRTRIRSTIEKAAANDPKQLRRRIAELERQAASKRPEVKTEHVEVPVVKESQIKALERSITAVLSQGERFSKVIERFTQAAGELAGSVAQARNGHRPQPIRRPVPLAGISKPEPRKPTGTVVSEVQLRKGERRMLETLITRHPTKLTRAPARNPFETSLIQWHIQSVLWQSQTGWIHRGGRRTRIADRFSAQDDASRRPGSAIP